MGAVAEDFLKELHEKMEIWFINLSEENLKVSKQCCEQFLDEAYDQIHARLMNNEFITFEDYYQEIEAFKNRFLEIGPPGPMRQIIMFEYL